MKRILMAVAALTLAGSALASNVGVSIDIGQPGFYGRIVLGDMPQPRVIYAEPMIIQRMPRGGMYQPIYLHVPPGHERNWKRHCNRYNACGQPVYFVQNNWYQDVYAPRYRDDHRERNDFRGGDDRYDRDNRDGRDDRGHGHGHGHDKGWKHKGRD